MVYSEMARVLLSTLWRRVLFHSAKCKSAPTLGQGLLSPPPNPTAGTAQPNTTQSARSGNMCYTKTHRQFRRPLNRPRQVRVITTQLRSSVPVSLLYSTTCVSVLCVTEHMYTSLRNSLAGPFSDGPFRTESKAMVACGFVRAHESGVTTLHTRCYCRLIRVNFKRCERDSCTSNTKYVTFFV